MADAKISALPASTTPLAGTEVLPIVQGSQTRQVSVANLTAGRSVSGTSFVPSGSAIPTDGMYLLAPTQLAFATNSTLRFLIDAAGYPTVKSAGAAVLQIENTANASLIDFKTGSTITGRIQSNLGSVSNIVFYTNAGTLTEKMRIYASGGVAIGNTTDAGAGALRVANDVTSAAGNFVVGTAGKGIDFSADPAAAGMTSELLDDYEEGTWTATLTDGTNNATMNASTCKYTKIGRSVFVCGNVNTTSLGSVTGDIKISGLPFAIASFAGGSIPYATNLNITAGQSVTLLANNSGSDLLLFLWDAATGTTWMQASEWSSDGNIVFSATYFV